MLGTLVLPVGQPDQIAQRETAMINTHFKKLILGIFALVAFVAGPANAAYTSNTFDIDTNGTPVASVVGTTFTDYFDFTLSDVSQSWLLTGVGTSITQVMDFPDPFPDVTILPVTFDMVQMYSGSSLAPGALLWTIWPGSSSVTKSGTFDDGSYFLKVEGHSNSAFGGTYVVALQALPVPEPGEWAMMLAGLGIVGFMARRRAGTS